VSPRARLNAALCFLAGLLMFAATAAHGAGGPVVHVGLGRSHGHWVHADGTLVGFGSNGDGQLGDGTKTSRNVPVTIATNVVRVFSGHEHTFFLKTDGTLWAMGHNTFGQLGNGTSGFGTGPTTPVQVASDVVEAAAAWRHSVILKRDGTAWVSGDLYYETNHVQWHQVGTGIAAVGAVPQSTYLLKADGTLWQSQWADGYFRQIAAGVRAASFGYSHRMELRNDGSLWTAGSAGALGDGTNSARADAVPIAQNVTHVRAGWFHSTFVDDQARLWTTGGNSYGQLGDGTWVNRVAPVQVAQDTLRVFATESATYFLRTNGSLWAAGSLPLSNGPYPLHTPKEMVAGGGTAPGIVTQLSASSHVPGHIVLTWDGTLGAIGYEVWRRPVNAGEEFVRIATVENALCIDGTATTGAAYEYRVRAWNTAGGGAFGASVTATATALPPEFTGQPQPCVVRIEAAAQFQVSVTANPAATLRWQSRAPGGAWTDLTEGARCTGVTSTSLALQSVQVDDDRREFRCVASNSGGEVASAAAALRVDGPVSSVSAGSGQSMFIRDGELWVTGDYAMWNFGAALGGTDRPRSTSVSVSRLAPGGAHSFFVKSDATLWGVGENLYGQLGDGTTQAQRPAVQVATSVTGAAAGSYHSVFVKADGSMWTMGDNGFGELGVSGGRRSTPTFVAANVGAVSAGPGFTAFLKKDGTLWTTGRNYSGQLGDGTTEHRNAPVQVATGVRSVSAGGDHTVFVKTDDTLWAMGWGYGATPAKIADGVRSASAGYDHVLFVKSDNTLWGMGENNNRQLGREWLQPRGQPMQAVLIDHGVFAASAGDGHSIYLRLDGAVFAMGKNDAGQIGNGSKTRQDMPTLIAGGVAPKIVAQPGAQTVFTQNALTLSVTPTGTHPFTYQWRRNGVPISGATARDYTVTSARMIHAGEYDVVVQSPTGTIVSAAATVVVVKSPQAISFPPPGEILFRPGPVTVIATSDSGLAVSFDIVSGPATVVNNALEFTGVGPVTMRALQEGDDDFLPALPVERTFQILPSYAWWQFERFSKDALGNPLVSGDAADPDGDGLPNLVEYALGSDPNDSGSSAWPELSTGDNEWFFDYVRPASRGDISFSVQRSFDLAVWSAVGVTQEKIGELNDGELWRARALRSTTPAFFRVKIERN